MPRRSLSINANPTQSGMSAAGTTQGTATAIAAGITHVSTAASGTGVVLPTSTAGISCTIHNRGANALLVYPPVSSSIDALAANAGFSLATATSQTFNCLTGTTWYSVGGGSFAPLASPTFTGVPAAPTASVGTDTTQLATTAFVMAAVKQIPFTAQNTAYTLVAGDAGRGVKKTDTTARTYTVNNSVFAADNVVTLGNYSSTANISVASGAGFTMYLAGTTTTGTRTIAPRGVATIVFESASVGYISGPGVT